MELGNIYGKHRSIVYYSSVNKKINYFNFTALLYCHVRSFHRLKTSDVGHTDSLEKLYILIQCSNGTRLRRLNFFNVAPVAANFSFDRVPLVYILH